MDKSWIDLKRRATLAYVQGCDAFLDFAFANNDGRKHINCPCKKCQNRFYMTREIAREHIICDGFNTHYRIWTSHGERYGEVADGNVNSGSCSVGPNSGKKRGSVEAKKKSDMGLRKELDLPELVQPCRDDVQTQSGTAAQNGEMVPPETNVDYFGSKERKQDAHQGTRRTGNAQVHEKLICTPTVMDKSWIDLKHRATAAYVQGCDAFLDFAFANSGGRKHINCPCKKCLNRFYETREIVREHIICDGFNTDYRIWTNHGERFGEVADGNVNSGSCLVGPTSGLKRGSAETKKKSDLGLRKELHLSELVQPSRDDVQNQSGMVAQNGEMVLPETIGEYFGSNERKRKSGENDENKRKQDARQVTRRTANAQVHEKKKKGMPMDAETDTSKDGEPEDTPSATHLFQEEEQTQFQNHLFMDRFQTDTHGQAFSSRPCTSCSCGDLVERVRKVEERNREITEEMLQMRETICALTARIGQNPTTPPSLVKTSATPAPKPSRYASLTNELICSPTVVDKSWIDLKCRISTAYIQGCDAFLDFAFANSGGRKHINCPCKKCQNRFYETREIVKEHIICDGFDANYRIWTSHGEHYGEVAGENVNSGSGSVGPNSGLKRGSVEAKKKTDLGLRKELHLPDVVQPRRDDVQNQSGRAARNGEMVLPETIVEYFGSNKRKIPDSSRGRMV